jgi:hypothetical protein
MRGVRKHCENKIKSQISGGKTPPRQGYIQQMIKGHRRTLVFTGTLANQAIKSGSYTVPGEKGIIIYVDSNISKHAHLLHEGTQFRPSFRQRRAIWAKVAKSRGNQEIYRDIKEGILGRKSDMYIIPSRPFITRALKVEETGKKFANAIQIALGKSLSKMTK